MTNSVLSVSSTTHWVYTVCICILRHLICIYTVCEDLSAPIHSVLRVLPLRGLDTVDSTSAIIFFEKKTKSVTDFFQAHQTPGKRSTLKGKNLLPRGANSFL